ncbi:MAG: sulfotransferase family protein, partial [Saprospiraceae bacterium]
MINKVFGIGLSKTGTSTLGEALNLLGIRTIHYPDDPVTLAELRSGNFRLSILNHFQAVVDTPVVSYYAQLDQVYPGSKFILTIRDMDSWLTSVQKHWETSATFTNQPLRKQFQEFIRTAVYGCIEFNRDRFQYVYNTHQQNVIQYFKDRPGDLL